MERLELMREEESRMRIVSLAILFACVAVPTPHFPAHVNSCVSPASGAAVIRATFHSKSQTASHVLLQIQQVPATCLLCKRALLFRLKQHTQGAVFFKAGRSPPSAQMKVPQKQHLRQSSQLPQQGALPPLDRHSTRAWTSLQLW